MENRVAASEYDLLMIARALVGFVPADMVAPLMSAQRAAPKKLGSTAMRLFKQTLSRGLPVALARRGGWRHDEFLSGEDVLKGRLWQRRPPPALVITPFSLQVCRLLAGQLSRQALENARLLDKKVPKKKKKTAPPIALVTDEVTLGDQLVLYLACDLVERVGLIESAWLGQILARLPALEESALCWLAFPELVVARKGPRRPDLATLVSGDDAVLFEALQSDVARRYVALEQKKRRLFEPARLIELCQEQHQALETLMQAAAKNERRDLMTFVITAAAKLLRPRPRASDWRPAFTPNSPLMQRTEGNEASAVLLDALKALQKWVVEAQGARFFDDEYEASQLLLRKWEQLSSGALEHAELLGRELRSMPAVVDEGAASSSDQSALGAR
jgi:hypothetical protein